MADKVCMVTGASSGIGLSISRQLLGEGWRVIGLARRPAPLEHPAYQHVRLDLGDLDAVQAYFNSGFARKAGLSQAGRVGLVNNAALLEPVGPVTRLTLKDLSQAYTVNTVVPVWLMGVFINACIDIPLRIANISSGSAKNPRSGWTAYCSTKAGLRMAGQVLAEDIKGNPEGMPHTGDLSILSYEPGLVDTAMQGEIREKTPEDFPGVTKFQTFHREGQLNNPDKPAKEVVDFLESASGEPYLEKRISGVTPPGSTTRKYHQIAPRPKPGFIHPHKKASLSRD